MPDRIPRLCARLLETEELEEIRPVADDLRSAIHEHIDQVGETARGILLLERVVNPALGRRQQIRPREDHVLSTRNLTRKANHERPSAQTFGFRMAAIG